MVAVHHVVVVAAEASSTVTAELCRGLAAALLMLLQFPRASKAPDIANLNLLAGLQRRIEREALARNRFSLSLRRSVRLVSGSRS